MTHQNKELRFQEAFLKVVLVDFVTLVHKQWPGVFRDNKL
jgi:hypothetical protein